MQIDLKYGYSYVLDEDETYSVLHKANTSRNAGYFLLRNNENRSYEHTIKYATSLFYDESFIFIDPSISFDTAYPKSLFFDFMLPTLKKVYLRGIFSISWHEAVVTLGMEAKNRELVFLVTRDNYPKDRFFHYDKYFDSRLYEGKFGYYIGEDYV